MASIDKLQKEHVIINYTSRILRTHYIDMSQDIVLYVLRIHCSETNLTVCQCLLVEIGRECLTELYHKSDMNFVKCMLTFD